MNWPDEFREETGRVIAEPFWRCLAEAIASVESAHGTRPIASPHGLNEIGYKAIAGHPSISRETREAGDNGRLIRTEARFRLFADRAEQARALAWLLRGSAYYDAARLLFVLAFYSGYAPGREAGALALVQVFNEIARSGAYPGVAPIRMIEPGGLDPETAALNHAAARQAVRLFARLTGAGKETQP
ncbi:hypothetical protein LLG95_04180 [bacterium]|nr:hypothetical protein [bacterium]